MNSVLRRKTVKYVLCCTHSASMKAPLHLALSSTNMKLWKVAQIDILFPIEKQNRFVYLGAVCNSHSQVLC